MTADGKNAIFQVKFRFHKRKDFIKHEWTLWWYDRYASSRFQCASTDAYGRTGSPVLTFAALTGYGAVIKETARQTVPRLELSENSQEEIKRQLDHLAEHIHEQPEVSITYFQTDQKKEGGAYVTAAGTIKRLDDVEGILKLEDGTCIKIEDIIKIQSSMLEVGE